MKTEQWQWSANKGWSPCLPSTNASLGASAQVVFLFGDTRCIEEGDCFDLMREVYPQAYLFGCTTGGEICGTYLTDETVSITAITFEHTRIVSTQVKIASPECSFEAGEQLAQSLDTRGLRHLLILSEGLKVSGNDLLSGVSSVLPEEVTISGGFAAGGPQWIETYVWSDGNPAQSSVAALAFYGDRLQVGVGVNAGWDTFGPDRLFTKARNNILYEVDGRPALDLYKQYLDEYAHTLKANGFLFPDTPNLLDSGLMFPLAVRVGKGQDRVVRAIIGTNEKEQSLVFAGNIPEQAYGRMMRGRIERLIDGARYAGISSLEKLSSSTPQFSLIVSCTGRRFVLKQRAVEEIEALGEILGEQVALAGFYSIGEIAPLTTGGQAELHNETVVVTSFAEV